MKFRRSAPTRLRWSTAGGGATGAERVLYNDYLTREDEKAVLAQVPSVMYSSPVLEMHDRISFGGGVVKDTLVLGVSPQYQQCAQPDGALRPIFRRAG